VIAKIASESAPRALYVVLVAAAVFVVSTVMGTAATAAQGPPSLNSAVAQYVETLPTSGGGISSRAAESEYVQSIPTSGGSVSGGGGGGGGGSTSSSLAGVPPALASALRRVSTSATYGAPTKRLPTDDAALQELEPKSSGSFLSSAASAVGTATRDRLFGLGVAMIVISAGALALAARSERGWLRAGRSDL
jgi:hypothetical protein